MRKWFVTVIAIMQILFAAIPAIAAPQSLWGSIYDDKSAPIAGVKVTISQGGKEISSFLTEASGSYSFNLSNGAYSMRLTPPNTNYSSLIAYDIDVPLSQALNFYLTKPTPGRSFVTGFVRVPKGFDIEGSVNYGAGGGINRDTGFFQMSPTAGTNATFSVTGNSRSDGTAFKVFGKTSTTILQDAMIDYNLPLYRQRIRIVDVNGAPIQGAYIDGGVGSMVATGTPNIAMNPVEGLGDFEGSWRVYSGTNSSDQDGYVNITALGTAKPAPATFTVVGARRYALQVFQTTVGNGDVVLKMTNLLPSFVGTVKDSNGKPIPGISVSLTTNNPGATSQSGGGGAAKADGSFEFFAAANPNYVLAVDYRNTDDPRNSFVFKTYSDKTNASIPQSQPASIIVPLQTTRVRVIDPEGKPIPNSIVEMKPNPTTQTEYAGKVTLISGSAPHNIYTFNSGVTDANGYVSFTTVKFDAEVDGRISASPPQGAPWTYALSIQKIGLGKDITVMLQRPFVNVSGRISFTDGTPLAFSSKYGASFSSTKGSDGAQISITPADGKFTGKVPSGITGSWTIGCGAIDKARAADFVPCISGGPTTVANKDWTQDLPVPTSKTQIQVVTSEGKGIPNVKLLVNSTFYSQATIQLFADEMPRNAWYISTATTDSNGFANIVNLRLANPQKVYLEVTPDATSRYPTRGLSINIGDNSKNVVVLEIPKPIISRVTVATVNGVKTATISGENFAGVFGVTAGTFSFNDFTNRTGAVTRQAFTVVSPNQITFPVPSGLTSGVVTVTNGGGTATSTMIRFN